MEIPLIAQAYGGGQPCTTGCAGVGYPLCRILNRRGEPPPPFSWNERRTMDRAEIDKIRQVIDQLLQQVNHLDSSMSVAVLNKSVLKKEALCNLLIRIAEHKHLIDQLEIELSEILAVDVTRITDSLNANGRSFS